MNWRSVCPACVKEFNPSDGCYCGAQDRGEFVVRDARTGRRSEAMSFYDAFHKADGFRPATRKHKQVLDLTRCALVVSAR